MILDEYQKKRNFGKTPEPRPGGGLPGTRTGRQFRFVIHKHDASHIHYDLRLEHGGALKSWAMPKGLPTPHDRKKLAIAVEDHPLDYLSFAGRIPEGQYGAGRMEIWDSGTYIPLDEPETAFGKGKLTLRLEGGKVRGEFTLARMKGGEGKGNEWLAILAKPEELNADLGAEGTAAPMPRGLRPMQAVLAGRPFSSADYLFEIKFDGIRALSYVNGGLSIMSRNLKEQAFRYPELADLAGHFLAGELIVDGEIVALDEQGVSHFQLLQGRINLTGKSEIAAAARATPAYYYVFDILYLNGRDLTQLPLSRRKEILSRLFMPHKHIRVSEWVEEQGEQIFHFARERGLEGIVGKRMAAPYRQHRSRDWLKFKAVRQQEFVIGGFTMPRGSRALFGALLLGVYEDGDLVYAGHVGTGFSEDMLQRLHAAMAPLVQEEPPFRVPPRPNEPAKWLRPELVAQVKFAEWTREGLLRHPVFLGLRNDMDPRDIVREEKILEKKEAAASGPREPSGPEVLPPFEHPPAGDMWLEVAGRELRLTNLDKELWPGDGRGERYAKSDLIDYYYRVSDFIVPHLAGRPLTLKRYPDGIGAGPFFQKEAPAETPAWLHTEAIPSESSGKRERIRYLVCDETAALIFIANLACIFQNPWLSALPDLARPDIIAFDLDPVDPDDFEACLEVALLLKDQLGGFGLRGYPKTSGATGLHVYVPVKTEYTFAQTRQFAELVSILCQHVRPDLVTLEQPVSRRAGSRLYLDFRQNVMGKTLASVYSPRAWPGAPVSTPLSWQEVQRGVKPADFTIANIPERLQASGDLFAGVLFDRQDLMEALRLGSRFLKTG
ncbi:MAG: DNA ligase D [Thermoleophilia bacterium]|nr:DNA ligase D [Thermoleophilia bacterium]